MEKQQQQQASGGIGFFGLLAIVFITLKLTGHIDWSWWWVLAPLWGPVALVLSMVLVTVIVTLMAFAFDEWNWKRK